MNWWVSALAAALGLQLWAASVLMQGPHRGLTGVLPGIVVFSLEAPGPQRPAVTWALAQPGSDAD